MSAPICPLSAESLFTGVLSYQGTQALKPSFTEMIVDIAKFSVNQFSLTKFQEQSVARVTVTKKCQPTSQ